MIKKLLLVGAAISLSMQLTGCNTIQGAGQDIQKGGRAIERAARQNRVDATISKSVRQALKNTPELEDQAISVSTKNNVVTLVGNVDNSSTSRRAVDIATAVSGVKLVQNKLTVG